MMHAIDRQRIEGALALLGQVSADAQLLQLKNLCVNNGTWSIPEGPSNYNPVLYEIQLFGVAAIAQSVEDLPRHWMKAARNLLDALPTPEAA